MENTFEEICGDPVVEALFKKVFFKGHFRVDIWIRFK